MTDMVEIPDQRSDIIQNSVTFALHSFETRALSCHQSTVHNKLAALSEKITMGLPSLVQA